MRIALPLLLIAAAVVHAGPQEDEVARNAIRDYTLTVAGVSNLGIESIKSRLLPVMKDLSPRYGKSIRYQLDRGYNRKYKKSDAFLAGVSEILAAGGKKGIATLYKRYKASMKRDGVRLGIARALAGCGDTQALSTLLKIIHDKNPEVAAAAVTGCGNHASVKEKQRKEAAKTLVKLYLKATNDAAGKDPESKQMKLYQALRAPMNGALKAICGGESLDSAEAWDSWLRENLTRPWTE